MQTFENKAHDVKVKVAPGDGHVWIHSKSQSVVLSKPEFDALYQQMQRAHHEAVNP